MSINQKLLERLMDCQDMALGFRDDRDCPEEYANYESNDDLLHEAEYLLSTYYEYGHNNCELHEEHANLWWNETAKLKRLINAIKKERRA